MFILKKGNQPGVYVPLRALFLVSLVSISKELPRRFSHNGAHIFYVFFRTCSAAMVNSRNETDLLDTGLEAGLDAETDLLDARLDATAS